MPSYPPKPCSLAEYPHPDLVRSTLSAAACREHCRFLVSMSNGMVDGRAKNVLGAQACCAVKLSLLELADFAVHGQEVVKVRAAIIDKSEPWMLRFKCQATS